MPKQISLDQCAGVALSAADVQLMLLLQISQHGKWLPMPRGQPRR